jgi:hypothetical protein
MISLEKDKGHYGPSLVNLDMVGNGDDDEKT